MLNHLKCIHLIALGVDKIENLYFCFLQGAVPIRELQSSREDKPYIQMVIRQR